MIGVAMLEDLDLRTLAKYPYLQASIQYARTSAPSLDELLRDTIFATARSRGLARALEGLRKSNVTEQGFRTETECIMELLSYVYARILISAVADPFLIRRYALGEALLANSRLQTEPKEFILDIVDEFGFEVNYSSTPLATGRRANPLSADATKPFELHFTDFLTYSTTLRSSEWKLANRDLKAGYVPVSKRELCRLVQEYLRKKFETELPLPVSSEIVDAVSPDFERLKNETVTQKHELQPEDVGTVSLLFFPPCMKQLLAMTQAGENLPHVARFALAAFLHHIGLQTEEILNVYSASPDFDPSKARYQIDHVTGVISGTEYTPPDCSTMKSYGICYNPDSLCKRDWLSHPLKYYRAKARRSARAKKRDKGAPEGTVKASDATEEDLEAEPSLDPDVTPDPEP